MKKETLNWLLENENPAIKYRTMVEICDKAPEDCHECYALIWEHKQITKMLRKQDENGLWSDTSYGYYTTMKNLTVFAEYGLYKHHLLDRYVDYTINGLESCYESEVDIFSCYAPSTLRALIMMGYDDRSEVTELISKFASTQIHDGGFMCKRKLAEKPERKSCYKAAVQGLLLYAECKRKNILPVNADNLISYFLKRDVFYSSDKTMSFLDRHGRPTGTKLGIPLIVSALSILGAGNHPGLQKAWEMMREKEDDNGRFHLEGTVKQPGVFGKEGEENKWVTFYALLAEKYSPIV